MQMNPNQPQRSCTDMVAEWWAGTPFINKGLLATTTILFILNVFMKNFFYLAMADVPLYTIYNFQVWRIFTAFVIHQDIFQLIFCLISLIFESSRLEKLLGSVAFLFDVILKNVEIQIFYLLIMYLLHFADVRFLVFPSAGLWDLVMVYITIRSASNPEQPTQFLCLPIVIKSKYYPFLIILLFSLISMMPFSLIAAMIVGYIETYVFNGMMLRLARNKAIWIENRLMGCFKTRPDFLSADNLDSQYFANVPANNNNNQGFIGGRGVAVGGNPPIISSNSNQNVRTLASNDQQPQRPPLNQEPVKKSSGSSGTAPFSGKGTVIGGEESDKNDSGEGFAVGNDQGKNKDYIGLVNEEEKRDKNSLI